MHLDLYLIKEGTINTLPRQKQMQKLPKGSPTTLSNLGEHRGTKDKAQAPAVEAPPFGGQSYDPAGVEGGMGHGMGAGRSGFLQDRRLTEGRTSNRNLPTMKAPILFPWGESHCR